MESILAAATKMRAIQESSLRSAAKLAEMQCQVCGRKAIVRNAGFGETVVVCLHIWGEIQRLRKVDSTSERSPLEGIQIEMFNDGPARW